MILNAKTKIKSKVNSNHFLKYLLGIPLTMGWLSMKFIINSTYRSNMIARLFPQKGHLQRSTYTVKNRYPQIFKECASFLLNKEHENLKLLSFGCSTGEEVFTLGEYLSTARIVGVDIYPWCIKQCIKKYTNNNFSFLTRNSEEFSFENNFDAVFCMAVFQRTENRKNKNTEVSFGFTFDQFEAEIQILDSKLKKGGLFVIDNSDFSFMDTSCAKRYKPLNFQNNQILRNRPLFNTENKRVSDTQNLYRVFEKND